MNNFYCTFAADFVTNRRIGMGTMVYRRLN